MPIRNEGPRHGGAAREATAGAQEAAELVLGGEQKEFRRVDQIPVRRIQPDPDQPRKNFPLVELDSLGKSMFEGTQIQPIIIFPLKEETLLGAAYQLVVGERRWRAAERAGIEFIDAIVLSYTPTVEQCFTMQIEENSQRQDWRVDEICEAILRARDEFKHEFVYIANQLFPNESRGSVNWAEDRYYAWKKADADCRKLLIDFPNKLSHVQAITPQKGKPYYKQLIREARNGASVADIRMTIGEKQEEEIGQAPSNASVRRSEEIHRKGMEAILNAANGITVGHREANYAPQRSASVSTQSQAEADDAEGHPLKNEKSGFDELATFFDTWHNEFIAKAKEWRGLTMSKGEREALKAKLTRLARFAESEKNRL